MIIIIITYFKRMTMRISVIKTAINLGPGQIQPLRNIHNIDRNMQQKVWVGEIEEPRIKMDCNGVFENF